VALLLAAAGGCGSAAAPGSGGGPPGSTSTTTTTSVAPPSSSTTTTTVPGSTTTTTVPGSTTTTTTTVPPPTPPAPPPGTPTLSLGASGAAVASLQQRLLALHYWVDTTDGVFDDSTQQAVFALQKAAGLGRDGVVGPATWAALDRGVEPRPRSMPGSVVEIALDPDLLMVVRDGALVWTLNTSTGGGYTYTSGGVTAVADTPVGHFSIYTETDGLVVDSLGELWRPKYFDSGFAIHGDSYVPPVPVSHGCVRVSDEAIDWIWATDLMPLGTAVWVY